MNRLVALALLVASATLVAACGAGPEEGTPSRDIPTPETRPSAGQVRITFYGHSMFAIESPGGVVVLTDPNEDIGYARPSNEIDVVTVSHDHFDHNKVEVAPGARVLRGLTDEGDWADIDKTVGDVRIRTVRSFHDDQDGADRGKNTMFLFEIGDLRIVHVGDRGYGEMAFDDIQTLEASVDAALNADLLMIPVGGHFTIGPQGADQVIAGLHPRLVIPMHYRTDALRNFPDADKLAPVDDFLQGKTNVRRQGGSTLTLGPEPTAEPTIIVLDFQPQ